MMTTDYEFALENTATSVILDPHWLESKAYRCHICLVREDDGSFFAIVLNLPGTGSCGNTEEETLKNVREAILGVIESHIEAGEEIPWRGLDECTIPEGAKQKWILVNA